MSAPHDNHSDSKYPEDKVSHYPKLKKMAKKAPKKKDEGIDMGAFFMKKAAEGHNPFKMVTHVGKKKAK